MNRFGPARLPLSVDDRKRYRKMREMVGTEAARRHMGFPTAPAREPPTDPLLLPIFNLSLREVEERSGVAAQVVGQWRTKKSPTLRMLHRVLGALGLRLAVEPIDPTPITFIRRRRP